MLVLGFELADALLLGGQRLADARLTELFSIDLRQPASHSGLSELHVSADLLNAQALPPDHLNDRQLEARVEDSSFRFRRVSCPGDFHPSVCANSFDQDTADEGIYFASESTFARVLRAHGQNRCGRAKAPEATRPPTTHIARAPRGVWCWDMTYLPASVLNRWFYPHLILDLYSRKIVGWKVPASDDSDHAAHLVRRTALAEGIATLKTKPVLHGDNGSTLRAATVLTMLKRLGVKPS